MRGIATAFVLSAAFLAIAVPDVAQAGGPVPTLCNTNADCSDNQFCNGAELCVDGGDGRRLCVPGAAPCGTLTSCEDISTCDEDADACADDCNENGTVDACEVLGGGQVLYGSQGGDTCEPFIFTIDPVTGEADILIDLDDTDADDYDTCGLTGLTLSPDGRTLYVSNRFDPVIFIIDLVTLDVDPLELFPDDFNIAGFDIDLSDLELLPDGRMIGSDPGERALLSIDLETGETIAECETEYGLSGLALSPGGTLYGSTGGGNQGGPSGTLFIVDLEDDCELIQIGDGTGFGRVPGLAFGPGGRLFGSTGFGSDGDDSVAGGGSGSQPELIEINTETGVGTLVAFITGEGVENIDGLAFGLGGDCNENGIPDDCDIDDGTSIDVDADGTPDECQPDCNENGVPDSHEILTGAADDCNDNGVPDECEEGNDCNDNNVLDECERGTDCNRNGIMDACDIAGGDSNDCNENGLPDECDIHGFGAELFGSQANVCDPEIFSIDPVTGDAELFVDLDDFKTCDLTGLTLSHDGGTLYASAGSSQFMFLIDTATQEVDTLNLFDDVAAAGESSFFITDLALLGDGTMIAADAAQRALRTINLDTGQAGIRCSTEPVALSGLALAPNGVLYGTSSNFRRAASGISGIEEGILYTVDPNTCAVQQIGDGTGFSMVPGLAFSADGRLFGATGFGSYPGVASETFPELIEIDTDTGEGTLVTAIFGKGARSIDGLAFGTGTSTDTNGNGVPDECDPRGGGPDDNLRGIGQTNEGGTYAGDARDESDRILAGIRVLQAPPRKQVSWRVTRVEGTLGSPGPGAGTSAGFADGVGYQRTFDTKITNPAQTYVASVFINLNTAELTGGGLQPEDVRLHVLNANQWEVAGTNDVGNAPATANVGDYGFNFSNGEWSYWAVRDDVSVFAVGAPAAQVQPEPDPEQPLPGDDDGDGVDNDGDLCPDTPAGDVVDADGCTIADDEPGQDTPDGEGTGNCGAGLPLCGATGLIAMLGMMLGLVGLRGQRSSCRRRGTR